VATVTSQVESYYRTILGNLTAGSRLPSERSVMQEMNVSRSTVRLVLTKLVAEKLLYPEHGRGYFKA
jgi:DNA-binding GntR family transcriptional regulator